MATTSTPTKARAAYIAAYLVALVVGLFLTDIPVWLRLTIGVLIMVPALLTDWFVSRRTSRPTGG